MILQIIKKIAKFFAKFMYLFSLFFYSHFYKNIRYSLFVLLALDYKNSKKFLNGYIKSDLKPFNSNGEYNINPRHPIAIIVVKNDLEKIKLQYNSLEKLGIEHFVYIDNGSTDGSLEFLISKSSVKIFKTSQTYNGATKNGWQTRIIELYGYDKWYLILDSDEILDYPYSEEVGIDILIDFFESKKIERPISFLVDMHPKEFNLIKDKYNLKTDFTYFDTNLYPINTKQGTLVYGGFRQNFFNLEGTSPWLTKYPLFKSSKNKIFRTHFSYPYSENLTDKFLLFIRHYKFTREDIHKFDGIISDGLYAKESLQYKIYKEKFNEKKIHANSEFSVKYNDSKDFLNIPLLDNYFHKEWKKYILNDN